MNSTTEQPTEQAAVTVAPLVWYVGEPIDLGGERADYIKNERRDRDGRFAPQMEAPTTKAQAWKKLEASSKRQSRAMDRLEAMETW